MLSAWGLQFSGLVAGFVGALLLVVAQGPGERDSGFVRRGGRVAEFLVLRYPKTWWAGLILLCAGFALQLGALVLA